LWDRPQKRIFILNHIQMNGALRTSTREKEEILVDELIDHEHPFSVIVWNDEVNTFEWVIKTLVEVCGHSEQQAEQCAYIIHFKGKYAVKQGSFDELKPICDAIKDRGIGATVEANQ
jgi:ATP-dependent Clp protease adaptor protein ClpS